MKKDLKQSHTETNKTLFDSMPKEFKSLVREYAMTDLDPDKFIKYVKNHIEDYKASVNMSVNKTLLMVQALLGSPVDSPTCLYHYSEEAFATYKGDLDFIILNVEAILKNLIENKKMPRHRDMNCVQDDTLASLTQNMYLYLYYYYQKIGNNNKAMDSLNEIVTSTERNASWLLSLNPSESSNILEKDIWTPTQDIDFFPGLYPFLEPLYALKATQPLNDNTIEAYEKYMKYLIKFKYSARNHEMYYKLFDNCKKGLYDLYINKISDLDDKIDDIYCDMSVLIRKKDSYSKKIHQIERPGIYPDDYTPMPF